MSHFTQQPHRGSGIRYTEKFIEEMLGHLATCAQNDLAAGYDSANVAKAVDDCGQVLRRAHSIAPKVFVIDLKFGSARLVGSEIERWCLYLTDTLAPCFTLRAEAHLLTENWDLSALELQEKLRGYRR